MGTKNLIFSTFLLLILLLFLYTADSKTSERTSENRTFEFIIKPSNLNYDDIFTVLSKWVLNFTTIKSNTKITGNNKTIVNNNNKNHNIKNNIKKNSTSTKNSKSKTKNTNSKNSKTKNNSTKVQKNKKNVVKLSREKKFAQEVLKEHNMYRAIHDVPLLQLDDKISEISQRWAEKMMKENNFNHSPREFRPDCGENLWWTSAYTALPKQVVGNWYDEIYEQNYVFGIEPSDLGAGHFTQLVWKTSKKLGVGIATGPNGTYVSCNYKPPGNYIGEFSKNVSPPKKIKKIVV